MVSSTLSRRPAMGASSRSPALRSLVLWGTLLVLAGPAAAQESAFTVCGAFACPGELQTLDLANGGTQPVGATGTTVRALAFDAAGVLWGIAAEMGLPDQLVTLDPATGATSVVGPLSFAAEFTDLTVDRDGALWRIADNELYSIDPVTGAEVLISSGSSGRLEGLAAWGGTLISVGGPFAAPQLVAVDKTTGEATPIADLTGLIDLRAIDALDFDRHGALWIDARGILPITPMVPFSELYRVADLGSGVAEYRFGYDPLAGLFYESLAIPRPPAAVDIPTLGSTGLAALILVLGLAGLVGLRRRFSADGPC